MQLRICELHSMKINTLIIEKMKFIKFTLNSMNLSLWIFQEQMCVNRRNDIFTIYNLFTSNRGEYDNTKVLNVPRETIYLEIYKAIRVIPRIKEKEKKKRSLMEIMHGPASASIFDRKHYGGEASRGKSSASFSRVTTYSCSP